MDTHYLTTGAAARLLGRTEPQLADLVRRGKIRPSPKVVAGRRIWTREQLLQAASVLGTLNDDLLGLIEATAPSTIEDEGDHRTQEVARGH